MLTYRYFVEPYMEKAYPLIVIVAIAIIGGAVSWTLINQQQSLQDAQQQLDQIDRENRGLMP